MILKATKYAVVFLVPQAALLRRTSIAWYEGPDGSDTNRIHQSVLRLLNSYCTATKSHPPHQPERRTPSPRQKA